MPTVKFIQKKGKLARWLKVRRQDDGSFNIIITDRNMSEKDIDVSKLKNKTVRIKREIPKKVTANKGKVIIPKDKFKEFKPN